jgi:hypothetical protein
LQYEHEIARDLRVALIRPQQGPQGTHWLLVSTEQIAKKPEPKKKQERQKANFKIKSIKETIQKKSIK